MTTTEAPATFRYFGRCVVPGCKHRDVREMTRNDRARADNTLRCPTHRMPTSWRELEGTFNAEKACNGRCMASTGPACSCACGGENHGTGHL